MEEEWEGMWHLGMKNLTFVIMLTGLYMGGGTPKYIKLRPPLSY